MTGDIKGALADMRVEDVGAAGLVELVDPRRDKKASMEKAALEDNVRQLEAQLRTVKKRLDEREVSETALAANLMETDVGDEANYELRARTVEGGKPVSPVGGGRRGRLWWGTPL